SLLVAKNDIGGVFVKLAEGDEAPALAKGRRAGGRTGNGEGLRVGKDAGIGFLGENTVASPRAEICCGAAVNVLTAFPIKEFRQAEDDAHQIVGAAPVIGL